MHMVIRAPEILDAKGLAALSATFMTRLGDSAEIVPNGDSLLNCYTNPRTAKVLSLLLNAASNPEVRVEFNVRVVHVAPGSKQWDGLATGSEVPQVSAVFAKPQLEALLNDPQAKKDGEVTTLPAINGYTNTAIGGLFLPVTPGAQGPQLKGSFTLVPQEGESVDLQCSFEYKDPATGSTATLNTQVLVWTGQTVVFGGFKGSRGERLVLLVTPFVWHFGENTADANEEGIDSESAAPEPPEEGR